MLGGDSCPAVPVFAPPGHVWRGFIRWAWIRSLDGDSYVGWLIVLGDCLMWGFIHYLCRWNKCQNLNRILRLFFEIHFCECCLDKLFYMGFISCENVVKKFGSFTALDHINLEIPQGKIFGFLGPNGAGKTTLIRIINRITLPTEGRVLFNGRELKLSDIENIGYLPEERGLYKKMKVGEQAVYLARLKGLSRADATRELMIWFQKFGIQPWWNKKVEELSKGMAQKIQFITTVLHKPQLLILDEPFSGFDPINVSLIRDEILRMKSEGCTIILSTHNMESVEELCDEIALVNKAKLVISGNVDQIRKEHGHNRVEVCYRAETADGVMAADGGTGRLQSVEGLFSVFSTENTKNGLRSVLDICKDASSRNVLSEISRQVEIVSYQPLMPKMNEIFIKLVGESGGATSQSIEDYRKSDPKNR